MLYYAKNYSARKKPAPANSPITPHARAFLVLVLLSLLGKEKYPSNPHASGGITNRNPAGRKSPVNTIEPRANAAFPIAPNAFVVSFAI